MKEKYNLKDVAALAGVSLGTASKVINHIYVKPESRLKVEAAMEKLNYTPNAIARSLKANTTRTIGVVIPDISSPVVGKVLKGIEDSGRKSGYSILIADTALNRIVEEEAIRMLVEKQVDGILYVGNTVSDKVADLLRSVGIPVVFVMTSYADKAFSSVTIDNNRAARDAVDYLCAKGHEAILMLAGEADDPNAGIPRLKGYCEALESHNIVVNPELVIHGGYRLERGYQDMERVLSGKLEFTAVFAVSDDVAIGAMKALAGTGNRIPDDISVMGFDGIDMIRYTVPSLTTVAQPFYRLGAEGIHELVHRINGGRANTNLFLPYEIVENDSVAERISKQ